MTDTAPQRNKFTLKCGPTGHRADVRMNGETIRGCQAITLSADLKGLTTVTVRYINCDVEFEADGFLHTEVTDITDAERRFVRIPASEIDGISYEDYVRRVRSAGGVDSLDVVDVQGEEVEVDDDVEDAEVVEDAVEEAVAVENAVPTRPGRVRNA